jgi:16S rRNA (guanine527-N7)-methyltransferase
MNEQEAKKFLFDDLKISAKSFNQLGIYVDRLIKFNKRYNLIGKSTEKEIWSRHIVDSAQIIKLIDTSKDYTLADLGSGAGLPGIIIGLLKENPNFHVKLYEKSNVKRLFLKSIADELKLNIDILGKIERDIKLGVDIIVSRAFKKFQQIIDISRENNQKNHKIIILLGKSAELEVKKASKLLKYPYRLVNSVTDSKSKIFVTDILKNGA